MIPENQGMSLDLNIQAYPSKVELGISRNVNLIFPPSGVDLPDVAEWSDTLCEIL